jgi:hypothetical protein
VAKNCLHRDLFSGSWKIEKTISYTLERNEVEQKEYGIIDKIATKFTTKLFAK